MSKNKGASIQNQFTEEPPWPTTMRSRLTDGRMVGTDNSVWVYREVPLAPIVDAASPNDALAAAEPLMNALDELAGMSSGAVSRRSVAKSGYREFHLILVNVPQVYQPPRNHPIEGYLRKSFGRIPVDKRVLLLGVKLQANVGGEGGFKDVIDSVVETLTSGGIPLSDFDKDFKKVDAALNRAGLYAASADAIHTANAWWNQGRNPDTPLLVHDDHLHFFSTVDAVRMANKSGVENCREWDEKGIPGQNAVTFACVEDLDLPFIDATDSNATWVSDLLDADALAVSIRGQIEPAKVTRSELRRQKKRYIDDINERAQNNKMQRAEQDEMLSRLGSVEDYYATGGTPTLAGCSIVVALDGQVEDLSQVVWQHSPVRLASMLFRQPGAMAEMMLCSNVRSNPNLHDLPSQSVAYSGIPSLSFVGDRDRDGQGEGAQLGFTQRDRQPAFLSPTAASALDSLPLCLVAGSTGSGKLTTLDTEIVTPLGSIKMRDIKVGDTVIGRDGVPCNVTFVSSVNETPDLYRVSFSDGQSVDADFDHQWIVSGFNDRNYPRGQKRATAIGNWQEAQTLIQSLVDLSDGFADNHESTLSELFNLVSTINNAKWKTPLGLRGALSMVDAPYRLETYAVPRVFTRNEIRKSDPVALFPVKETLEANIAVWENLTGINKIRWGQQAIRRAKAAKLVLATTSPNTMTTAPAMIREMEKYGAIGKVSPNCVRDVARKAGVESVAGFAEVVLPIEGDNYTISKDMLVFGTAVALKSLALRVSQQYADKPTAEAGERVMSTGEMLGEGIRLAQGHANFAVCVASPTDFPVQDLVIDPYVLGAWLGDGSSYHGQITQGDSDVCIDEEGLSDKAYILSELNKFYDATPSESCKYLINVRGLKTDLRTLGVIQNKHMPAIYLRASYSQRLALLQGLMDTDGTVDMNGNCELTLCNKILADDALELIRSMGIKCNQTFGPAMITENDPDNPGHKRRRQTSIRYRMHFTTLTQVFRLPRKLNRQKEEVRTTQDWLYITSIEPIVSAPGRCIQVDSPDSTYLVKGFIPTHNSVLMLNLADQYSRMGTPVVIVDPKTGSDHSAVVLAAGGQVASLDDLAQSDGVFDPIRFSATKEVGVELAASMLMSINPWGTMKDNMEVPLQHALSHGVSQGAECVGQALRIAERDLEGLPENMIKLVFDLATSSPMFRACVGVDPHSQGLRAAKGITLIKVGNAHLDLPEPGIPPASISQRIAMALVRMMVFGSAMALTGRQGVVMLDEAWVFLGAGSTEVQRLGRLARSQEVLPMLFTQRVSDAIDAKLEGFISRGLILPIEDRDEALAACRLFKLEPTAERMAHITAKGTMSATSENAVVPNWDSMRALRDPKTNRVLRGSIAIYADIHGRAIPVEIALSPEFLRIASTNPEDIRRRLAEQQGQPQE